MSLYSRFTINVVKENIFFVICTIIFYSVQKHIKHLRAAESCKANKLIITNVTNTLDTMISQQFRGL